MEILNNSSEQITRTYSACYVFALPYLGRWELEWDEGGGCENIRLTFSFLTKQETSTNKHIFARSKCLSSRITKQQVAI